MRTYLRYRTVAIVVYFLVFSATFEVTQECGVRCVTYLFEINLSLILECLHYSSSRVSGEYFGELEFQASCTHTHS